MKSSTVRQCIAVRQSVGQSVRQPVRQPVRAGDRLVLSIHAAEWL